jgi:hypothetical protein
MDIVGGGGGGAFLSHLKEAMSGDDGMGIADGANN